LHGFVLKRPVGSAAFGLYWSVFVQPPQLVYRLGDLLLYADPVFSGAAVASELF